MTGKFTLMALSLLWMVAAGARTSTAATTAEDLPLNKIRLPPGFEISLFARVPNARSMTLSPNGTLFVGTRRAGNVYAIATRGDRARSRGGTGLGLAIVDAIARSHGRTAGAAAREGGGADVWIELPGSNVHLIQDA